MPDTRTHRGAHPEDAVLFAREQWPVLQQAMGELCWLLDRGYAMRSALALVGNRHSLTERQRVGLVRSACSKNDRDLRSSRCVPLEAVRGAELWIDGYNLLITIEAALGGGVILHGRDGCCRDLASLHGTYRHVVETEPALLLVGETLARGGISHLRWVLDRPVSNSGRLKERMRQLAAENHWAWDIELEYNPDAVLANCSGVIATSDSAVLDRCSRWTDVARRIVFEQVPGAFVVEMWREAP